MDHTHVRQHAFARSTDGWREPLESALATTAIAISP